jgi:hypothetical protein
VVYPKRQLQAQESIGRLYQVKLIGDVNGLESGLTPVDVCLLLRSYLRVCSANYPAHQTLGFGELEKGVNQGVIVSDEGAMLLSRGKL